MSDPDSAKYVQLRRNAPLTLDQKRKINNSPQIGQFVLNLLVVLPILLSVLLPLALLFLILQKLCSLCRKQTPRQGPTPLSTLSPRAPNKNEREFDIVLFGATGFTGGFAAEYLARNYSLRSSSSSGSPKVLPTFADPDSKTALTWAIAGRSKTKLESLRAKLAQIDPGLAQLRLVLADSSDLESVDGMTKRCRVLVSTAGPFQLFGSNVVRSCAANGTDYCDITGEIDWMQQMIDCYGAQARASGARVVFGCGADSAPWDLACLLLRDKLARRNEDLVRTDHFNEGKGGASGGSLRSIMLALDGKGAYSRLNLQFDPLLSEYDGQAKLVRSDFSTQIRLDRCVARSPDRRGWTALSLIGVGNSRVVSRSNALLHYHNGMVYREAMVYPHFVNAFNWLMGLVLFMTLLALKPLRWVLLRTGLLPSPGQGPDSEALRENYYTIESVGFGSKGSECRLRTTYDEDFYYVDTARILIECGLCFVFESEKCQLEGGMLTPASCFGASLKTRLEQSGTIFEEF